MGLVSKKCVEYLKTIEGFEATPRDDGFGFITLGYGMTGSEIKGIDYVTQEQATKMLEDLINKKYAPPVKNDLDSKGIKLNQNQFDAIVSFAYNVGICGLLGSTLYKNICSGNRDRNTITSNFRMWSKVDGKTVEGLLKRRTEEAQMFFETETLNKNAYCMKWQAFYNKVTNSEIQLSVDGLCGSSTLKSLAFLLTYIQKGVKYRYCEKFQSFYNEATQTGSPIDADGLWGIKTEKAYDTMVKLVKGVY